MKRHLRSRAQRWRAVWRRLVMVRFNRETTRQQLTAVLEQDDTIAEKRPALRWLSDHDVGGFPVRVIRSWAARTVVAHGVPSS